MNLEADISSAKAIGKTLDKFKRELPPALFAVLTSAVSGS
jgi:hypothetical protein